MRNLALVVGLFLAPAIAKADTLTARFGMVKMSTGTTNWGTKLNVSVFDVVDSSAAGQFVPNTFTASNTFTAPSLFSGSSVTLTGANGRIVSQSSITTLGGFFGSGAGLSNVTASSIVASGIQPGTLGTGVLLPAGSLTNGPVASSILPSTVAFTNVANGFTAGQTFSSATVTGNAFSVGGTTLVVNGGTVSINQSSNAPGITLGVNGAVRVGGGATQSTFSVTGALFMASGSSVTLLGSNGFISAQSSITTSGGFFGNGSALTRTYNVAFSSSSSAFSTTSTSFVGITGTTATITGVVSGNRIKVCAGIQGANGTNNQSWTSEVIVEGKVVSQLCLAPGNITANTTTHCSGCYITATTSGGTITGSLMALVSGGTFTKETSQPAWVTLEEIK